MGGFYTDEKGNTRPIADEEPKKKKGAGAVLVGSVLVGLVLAGGITTAGGFAGGTAGVGGAADSVVVRTIQAKTPKSRAAARRGEFRTAWRRLGVRAVKRGIRRELRCGLRSYGEVQKFFLRHPCRSLRRRIVPCFDAHGNSFVVSIAWVRMSTTDNAGRFKRLADTDGTGNVTPLANEVLEFRGVRFTGRYYDSRSSGSLVVVAEAAPVSGTPDGALLDAATQVAVMFPAPR